MPSRRTRLLSSTASLVPMINLFRYILALNSTVILNLLIFLFFLTTPRRDALNASLG